MFYLYMSVMNIMNVLRTGMDVSVSHIHVGLCNISNIPLYKESAFQNNSCKMVLSTPSTIPTTQVQF